MHEALNYSIYSNTKHRQYESNKVINAATKHSLCPGNGVFAREKCIIFVLLRVSIASYASAGIARGGMSVCLSVCLSHSGIVSKRRNLAS